MDDPRCILCDETITPLNDSDEHVLPNAVGGRLKIRSFLCKPCNDQTGHSRDAELARQLQGLSLLVGVDRDRGETPPMLVTTTSGQALKMTAKDGLALARPVFEVTETEDGHQIRIQARTMSEARRMIEGAKAKFPKLDVEGSLAKAEIEWAQPQGYMQQHFVIGGYVAGRSIVKSAVAYAALIGLPRTAFMEAVEFLRDPIERAAPLGWFYASDVLEGRPNATPVTCVGIHANPATGLLLGYVEYFGFHRAVVELGRGYRGQEMKSVHGFDPRTALGLPLSISLPFDEAELQAIFDYERVPDGAMEHAIREILPQALKRQLDDERDRVIGDAVEHALKRSGLMPGDEIGPDHANLIAALTTDYMKPWIAHRIAVTRRARRGPPHAIDDPPE